MHADLSPARRAWNRFFTAAVWAAAILVMVLVAGILGMVLVRGIPHISWKFLTTTASVLKGTDGILPAILNTLYVILLTLLIVLPLGVRHRHADGREGHEAVQEHAPEALAQ